MDWSVYLRLIREDIDLIIHDLSYLDFLRPLGFILWLLILSQHLRNIDRRDQLAGSVYSLFLALCGLILVVIYPEVHIQGFGFGSYVIFFFIFVTISLARWNGGAKTIEVVKGKNKATE